MKTRIKAIHAVYRLLKTEKWLALFLLSLILVSSIITGGIYSAVLPLISKFFFSSSSSAEAVTHAEASGFYAHLLKLYSSWLPQAGLQGGLKEILPVLALVAASIGNAALLFTVNWLNGRLTARVTHAVRIELFRKIKKLKWSEFQSQPVGNYIQLIIQETRLVFHVSNMTFELIANMLGALVVLLLLATLSWRLTLILCAGSLAVFFANLFILRALRRNGQISLRQRMELSQNTTDSVMGLKQARLMNAVPQIETLLYRSSWVSEDLDGDRKTLTGLQIFTTKGLGAILIFCLLAYWRTHPAFDTGLPKQAAFITFLFLASRIFPYASQVSQLYGTIVSSMPAIYNIQDFLDEKLNLERNSGSCPDPLLREGISFNQVSFAYGGTSAPNVLSELSLEIKKGDYFGIMGPSGIGKTSLINLLVGLHEPQGGAITLDDRELRSLDLEHLRSKIGIVSQDSYLFDLSVRENLMLAKPDASEIELWQALEKAGIAQFIGAQADRLELRVGHNGSKLSAGQKQRLALAMLFLRDPEVILLDEATSSVDAETEKAILASFKDLHRQGKTIISIAHKSSALTDAQRVYTFQ